ncbi:MAG: hypothetical protein JW867_05725 [Candidatus Omnitrophica bacterium]|nr:hypothetical protein [Candidatus Omnitrophota bacterium]
MFLSKIITILGFSITLCGIHKVYCSIKPETKRYEAGPDGKDFEGALIEQKLAKEGIRFVIYGFLIQALSLIYA